MVLVSFDSHNDLVSVKIFVSGNILDFPRVNWAQKMTKTFNFGYFPFRLKHLILKYCEKNVCLMRGYLWS